MGGLSAVLHAISLGLVLFGTWLLLSGFFKTLLLALGVGSCLLVVWILHRMDVVDHEGHPVHLGWRGITYWGWLTKEIVKSSIDVSKRILDPRLPVAPRIVHVKATQRTELGQVIFANSITLTPGTVSMRVQEGMVAVHSLAPAFADDLAEGTMNRRVCAIEGENPPELTEGRR